MKVSIVKIGNSKGVILPKSIRELIGLSTDKADMTVEGDAIIISPIRKRQQNNTRIVSRKKLKNSLIS